METVQTRAYAKINLGLRILRRREDGFHELRTLFQTISLADTVRLSFGRGRGVRLEGVRAEPGVGWPAMAEADNLAVRAAVLARQAWGVGGAIGVHLHKRIPLGAGLGGGSADAAAVLRLMAARARRPLPPAELHRVAAELGSDVPALLCGGTVLGLGRGEECYPLPSLPPWHCLLAAPAMAVKTATAFQRWDALHLTAGRRRPARRGAMAGAAGGLTGAENSATIQTLLGLLRRTYPGGPLRRVAPASRFGRDRGLALAGSRVRAGIENDFDEAVFPLSPDFSVIRSALRRAGAVWVGLSGSGAAQYGLFGDRTAAEVARAALPARARSWTARFVRPAAALAPW